MEPQSPTQTIKWLKCPTFWYLDQRWEQIGPWKPHLALGAAIDVGLEVLFNVKLDVVPMTEGKSYLDVATNAALTVLESRYEPNDEWTIEALQHLMRKGLQEAVKSTVAQIVRTEQIMAVQLEIGSGRIDLVTKRGDLLIVTDHKVSLQMKAEYVLRNLAETESDWQLWDYAYRAREYYQHKGQITIRRHLGVLTPRTKWHLHESTIRAEVLDGWSLRAEKVWNDLADAKASGTDVLPMFLTSCRDRYGKCSFYDGCHVANRDPEKMQGLYRRKR